MLRTGSIFALTLIGSLPLGMVVALLRKSHLPVVRGIIRAYISLMRGTPLMLQLIALYFGPYYLFGWSIRGWRFSAVIIGFILNYAAYFAEIYRGGSNPSPPDSMRRRRSSAIQRPGPSCASSCRRSSSGSCLL